MKIRTILLSMAALLAVVVVCFAAEVNMGTWKLNEVKSKISPGAGKNTMVVIAPAGDSVTRAADEGKAMTTTAVDRRQFLVMTALAGGGLALAVDIGRLAVAQTECQAAADTPAPRGQGETDPGRRS